MTMRETIYCARHKDTPTNLRCSRCETPICPRCMVQTPVGARCKDCAQVVRSPIYSVPPLFLARAVGVSLAIGIGGGLALLILGPVLLFGSILLYPAAMAGLGYLVSEGISAATNRKRGRPLQFVAAGGVLVATVVVIVVYGVIGLSDLLGAAIGIAVAVGRLR